VLTVKQVAERLNVKASTIYEAVEQGLLQCFRIRSRPGTRGTIRISEEHLRQYLEDAQPVSLPEDLPHLR